MKKLSQHIKPLALSLTFLLAFAIAGRAFHYVFSDCDHNIALHSSDHDDDLTLTAVDHDYLTCDLFEFTNQTTTLVQAPSLVSSTFSFESLVKESIVDQIAFQQHSYSFSLRGPPFLS